MNKISTIQLDETQHTPNNWANNYIPLGSEVIIKVDTLAPILYLPWDNDQHVVTSPKSTLYILFGKRIVDIFVASFVIIFILSWLIPIVGVVILCESRGPVFFVQGRSGRKAKPFPCLKFRTMRYAPQADKFEQTNRNDSRVTQIGSFLRKTNLDEMPQFLNVLTGDMSLVGPRPHAVPHDALHWDSIAYRERYWVKPGITGLAQVKGSRGATTSEKRMEHRVRYDHFYIENTNFLLDMKICVRTVTLMLEGDKNAW